MSDLTSEQQAEITAGLRQRKAMTQGVAGLGIVCLVLLAAVGLPIVLLVAIACGWVALVVALVRRHRSVVSQVTAAGWRSDSIG